MDTKIRSCILSILTTIFGIMLVSIFVPRVAGAQDEEPTPDARECEPFDIVFLIDQSESMDPEVVGFIRGSDPFDQRIQAVNWFINAMGFQSLFLCDERVVNRVGVIPFGTEVDEDILALAPIDPSNADEWEEDRDRLASEFEAKTLGGTNFISAFDVAEEMFSSAPSLGDDIERQRAIVLLTDGTPSGSTVETTIGGYMETLSVQILTDFDPDQYYLWVIGIDRFDMLPEGEQEALRVATNAWRDLTSNYLDAADDTGSQYRQLGTSDSDIPVTFSTILEQLSPRGSIDVQCQNVAVEPYLERVQFEFFRTNPDNAVELTALLDGQEVTFVGGEPDRPVDIDVQYLSLGLNEVYLFSNPWPGMWGVTLQVAEECEQFQALYTPIQGRVNRVEPAGVVPQYIDADITGTAFDEDDPYYLKFEIVDQFGERLPFYSEYPLNAEVTINFPGESEPTVTGLAYNGEEDIWQTEDPLPAVSVGDYTYSLTGTALRVDGTERITIFTTAGIYEVGEKERFSWRVLNPLADTTSGIRSGIGCFTDASDLTMELEVTEYNNLNEAVANRAIINPAQPFVEPETAFLAQIETPSNETVEVPFSFEGGPSNLGLYLAEVEGERLEEVGEYKLTVTTQSEIREDWLARGQDVEIVFARDDTFVTSNLACQGSIGLSILLAVVVAGTAIYTFTDPPKGTLIFETAGGQNLFQVSVDRSRRKSVIRGDTLAGLNGVMEDTKIRKVSVQRGPNPHNKNPNSSSTSPSAYISSGDEPSIIVEFIDNDGASVYEGELENCGGGQFLADTVYVRYSRFGDC